MQVLHGKEKFDLMTGRWRWRWRWRQNRSLEARGLRSLALKNDIMKAKYVMTNYFWIGRGLIYRLDHLLRTISAWFTVELWAIRLENLGAMSRAGLL